jgi:hypothetical protein
LPRIQPKSPGNSLTFYTTANSWRVRCRIPQCGGISGLPGILDWGTLERRE